LSLVIILLELLIVAIVVGLIVWLATQIPFIAPYANIIRVAALCLFIIYAIWVLIGLIGGAGHLPLTR
jgi:hypothetical protein